MGVVSTPVLFLSLREERWVCMMCLCSTGGFGQYFQLCSHKYRFTHKTPWECQPQFSRFVISISLSLREERWVCMMWLCSTGGFGQYFQLCSHKYRFTHKTPWECRPQFSRCIISDQSLSSPRPNGKHTRP